MTVPKFCRECGAKLRYELQRGRPAPQFDSMTGERIDYWYEYRVVCPNGHATVGSIVSVEGLDEWTSPADPEP